MTAQTLILALALLAAGSALAAGSGKDRMHARTGVACDRSSGEPLYRELHEERWEDGRLVEDRVTYRRPGGEVFAVKRVDYRASPVAPEFELVNSATGHQEALQREGEALVVRYRPSDDEPERSATLPFAAALIADAGFDRFVALSWDRLVAGEMLVRPFLIPSRLGSVDMRVRRLRRRGDSAIAFELAIDSALLRLVLPAIRVYYDASARTLLRYEGTSNLRGVDGTNMDVTIEFSSDPAAAWNCRQGRRGLR